MLPTRLSKARVDGPPAAPKIYHIVHVDRLSSIITDGYLWCDARVAELMQQGSRMGTTIGMNSIKERRLNELTLTSHPDLFVGQCVPFYFCPRSVMLYLLYRANHRELSYTGGQDLVVHLEADLRQCVAWAESNRLRWAFTLTNAGSRYFEDRSDLSQLGEIDWDAVNANRWSGIGISRSVKEGKQAEFLVERYFPWKLVTRIGVRTESCRTRVRAVLRRADHRPTLSLAPEWYYG